MCRSAGLTLIEMLTSLTVLAVLGALAVPMLSTIQQDAQRTAAVNSFIHSVFLARSEAIKRGEVVTLCASRAHERCEDRAREWSAGWIVFVNRDRDDPPQRDTDEPLLSVYPGVRTADARITSNRPAYSFRAHRQGVVNGTVVFCDRRGAAHARAVIISHTGRPRVAQRDASNNALRCPTG